VAKTIKGPTGRIYATINPHPEYTPLGACVCVCACVCVYMCVLLMHQSAPRGHSFRSFSLYVCVCVCVCVFVYVRVVNMSHNLSILSEVFAFWGGGACHTVNSPLVTFR